MNSSPDWPNGGFGKDEIAAARKLIALALQEDCGDAGDLTSRTLISRDWTGRVRVVSRQAGVLAGLPVVELAFAELDESVECEAQLRDGDAVSAGSVVAEFRGPLHSLLTGERTALNFLTHLSGVATITRQFVDAVAGTGAAIFDTRKTHPCYRVLEKYAVRVGGGRNHRMGLYDGILIKDNHIAALQTAEGELSLAEVVRRARAATDCADAPVEMEVDTLEQLLDAIAGLPDQILLDNMSVETLREAVRIRNQIAPAVQLEASGGVTLETVRAIAETGVERISVGALTHSARYVDLGFDWPRD